MTAETYERALRSLHRYNPEQGPIAAWLCGIARNVAHEQARKRGWPLIVSLLPEVLDRLPGRADTVERSRRDDLLDELTAAQREVVSLRLAGFKVREIACTLGKADAAYFEMINATGGINGRKVEFISRDDAFSPPKTGKPRLPDPYAPRSAAAGTAK